MTCGLATALEPPHFNHAPVRGATPAPDLRIRGRVVSIHAPAWGATFAFRAYNYIANVSIHAPAWGATNTGRHAQIIVQSFNPRTRVGCDNMIRLLGSPETTVSIHAPAWGATPERPGAGHILL